MTLTIGMRELADRASPVRRREHRERPRPAARPRLRRRDRPLDRRRAGSADARPAPPARGLLRRPAARSGRGRARVHADPACPVPRRVRHVRRDRPRARRERARGRRCSASEAAVFVAALVVGVDRRRRRLAAPALGPRLHRPGRPDARPGQRRASTASLQLLTDQTVSGITAGVRHVRDGDVDRLRPDGLGRRPAAPVHAGDPPKQPARRSRRVGRSQATAACQFGMVGSRRLAMPPVRA